jgi:hypothetical protein
MRVLWYKLKFGVRVAISAASLPQQENISLRHGPEHLPPCFDVMILMILVVDEGLIYQIGCRVY